MKIRSKDRFSVFNLEDTNGKSWKWGEYPNLTEYNFYKRVISSPEFKGRNISKFKQFEKYIESKGLESKSLSGTLKCESSLIEFLDKNVEQRSRHYVSNLAKLGLVNKERVITPVGRALLDKSGLFRSKLEESIVIADDALIILRQLAKLTVNKIDYDTRENITNVYTYSPFNFLIGVLLKKTYP